MKSFLKLSLLVLGVVGIPVLGFSLGTLWGFLGILTSSLIAASSFVMLYTPKNNKVNKNIEFNKTAFNASLSDDKTYNMEKVIGSSKGTYLSNKKQTQTKTEFYHNDENNLSI